MEKLSMEVRLLIAFLLMGLVIVVSQYLAPPPAEQPAAKSEPKAEKATPVPAAQTPPPAVPAPAEALPGAIAAETEETVVVETTFHKVTFSNRGAVVTSWILKRYTDGQGNPLDLVNQAALQLTGAKAVPPPFAIAFKGQAPSNDPNDDLFRVTEAEDGTNITFEFSDGRTSAKKNFHFRPGSYELDISSQVMENGVLLSHALVWRGGFGDESVSNRVSDARAIYYDAAENSLEKKGEGEADDGPVPFTGRFAFAGIEDKYFAAVAVPTEPASLEITVYSDAIPGPNNEDEQRVGVSIGGSGLNAFPFFAGPKDDDILRASDPRLEQLIDWGTWFGFLAKPLFFGLRWIADNVTAMNYGWAIVILTIVINCVLFPLRLTSMKSSRKMQALQPELQQINERYKGKNADPMKQREEMMALYQRHGVNPVGGCLPMLLQFPFFIALYTVLSVAIELRGADWLWINDLSQPEAWEIRLLPLIMAGTQFLSQRLSPSPGMDPTQQKVMMIMPFMFLFMFWGFAAGLVLYWLTSNVVSIVQQLLLNRFLPAPVVVQPAPAPKKKR